MNFVCSVTSRVEEFSFFHLRLPNRRGKSKHSTSAQDQRSPWGRSKGRMIGWGETVSPKLKQRRETQRQTEEKRDGGAKCSQGRSFISWKRPPNIRLANRMLPSLPWRHLIASSLSSLQQVLRVWVWWCDQPPVLPLVVHHFFLGCSRCRTVKTTFVQGHKRSINAGKSKHTYHQQDAQTRRPAIPSQICVSSGKTAN